jgi:glutamyl-tRNA synthetase
MATPRVRFCPAPSGWLHVGSARTALYNWLHARQQDGVFVFRMEDTDAERATVESMRGMIASMRWLGLDWDEGPEAGGAHGPYRQSERAPLYAAVARRLLVAGHAYEAFETAEELEADRERARAEARPPGYSGGHRDLTEEQKAGFRAEGRLPVLRLRTPDEGAIAFDDLVRGRVEFAWKDVFDFVIHRADGSATYPLANTVDDLAQGITLVARGEDLLSSTPRQLLLAQRLLEGGLLDEALAEAGCASREPGWGPIQGYAHLPVMVGPDRKKLSKRHGAVAVDEFRRQGILPEVLVNLLALCGWGYDGVREQFSVEELVRYFSFDRVGRNPALFDTEKLRAFNGDAIKSLEPTALADRLVPYFAAAGLLGDAPAPAERALLERLVPLLQERIQTLAEAPALVAFCFRDEVAYDERAVGKHLKGRAGEVLDEVVPRLEELEDWTAEAILAAFDELCEKLGLGRGKVMQPVRVAVAGTAVSPPLPETLAVMDRDIVLQRIRAARPLVRE